MPFSKKPAELLLALKEFSRDKIINADDVVIILEISQLNEDKLFDDLIFKAKYLNGLGKIIHSGLSKIQDNDKGKLTVQTDTIDKVKNEYKINLNQFISQIKELIKNSSEEVHKRFEDKYFKMDQASMMNLTTLIYDLSWVKKFKNSTKK